MLDTSGCRITFWHRFAMRDSSDLSGGLAVSTSGYYLATLRVAGKNPATEWRATVRAPQYFPNSWQARTIATKFRGSHEEWMLFDEQRM